MQEWLTYCFNADLSINLFVFITLIFQNLLKYFNQLTINLYSQHETLAKIKKRDSELEKKNNRDRVNNQEGSSI